MPKGRLVVAQFAAFAMMVAAVWFITAVVPMHAQAQTATDDVGVTVSLGGASVIHRSPITYPVTARTRGIEGSVSVQVHLDANGEVTDDTILSGPDELRKGVQQSILNWHFDKSFGSTTQVIHISFVKTPDSAVPMVVTPAEPVSVPPTPNTLVRAGRGGASPAVQAQLQMMQNGQLSITPEPSARIDNIEVLGLSDMAKAQLLAQLPVHVGDVYSRELARQVADAVHQFDDHLQVSGGGAPGSGRWTFTIRAPGAPVVGNAAAQSSGTSGAQKIGANVMAANLIQPVTKPVYPPLAKMARQQGTVKFDATIGQDGKMADLKLISGPPLLVQAAMDAVKTWTYQPTYLNGQPVAVQTTIDVSFTLDDSPSAQ